MGHPYFRQAKFAQYRFRPQLEQQRADNDKLYLESKQPKEEIAFVQCWNPKCLSVMHLRNKVVMRCKYCDGRVEILTIDGVPQ